MKSAFFLLIALAVTLSAQGPASMAGDMLAAHNAVRARVKVPPLTWSDALAARAQEWAHTLLERHQFEHRPNSTYGENLFEIDGASTTPARVVDSWAAESRNYDYGSNKC
ncbi:MAG TPA: CAP domain-containing protein, partial [Verrucomicrobiae bacterium]|nr:CAP domain-containing protein [Verrucomicrobiae bacterium]